MKKRSNNCPGSYEVSGYTTDSGKKVDSYTRRCWKHGEGGNVNIVSDKKGNSLEGTIYEKPNSGENLSGSGFVSESDNFDNVIINLNEGENPFPSRIFEKANPPEDLPVPQKEEGNNWGEIALGALLSLGTVAGSAYLSYLMNRKVGKTNFSSANLPKVSGEDNFVQTTYKNFELSKFDPKKTETDIKNSMKNIEGILKQKEVSNNDISMIRGSLKNSVGSICNDIESISYRRSQQPEIPTVESMEAGKTIEKDRKQTIDNATNVITSINLAQNALKKNFDFVKMDSPEYNKKLYEYVRQSDELKKMSNSVMNLFHEAKSPTKNSINTVNKIRQDLGFAVSNIPTFAYNGTTGSAAGINNKLAFENISIPYENAEKEEKQTVLQSHIEKIDFNSKYTQNIIRKLMKFIKNKFLLSLKDNNELSLRDIAVELYLYKDRLLQKDKIDDLLNVYVEKNKVPIEMTNDLRHRAGSALMSKYTKDTDLSRIWGNLKEIRDLVIGKENDTNIDSRNNAIGRKIYLENKTATDKEIIDIVYEGIKNNKNYNVDIKETKIPLQEFFYFINNYTYKK